ncbi:elongation factor P [Candidatus Beckwithbacteria bacterium]|nr:elongation factor P [Candidatus Beckwithbacteria bacterium]
MYQSTDLKIGKIFIYNDEPYKVLEYKHTHMGRGGADIRLKVRGLVSDNVIPLVFSPTDRFEEANLTKKKMQFLYREEDTLNFMNPETYEQVELNAKEMGEEIEFLKDGEEYNILYWDEKALSVEIPPKVVLQVIECDPGVKGNSAANMYKAAVVEGGIRIKVPLFIEQGENIRIDTINRKYVERANK